MSVIPLIGVRKIGVAREEASALFSTLMNRIDRLMGITLLLQGRRVTRAEDIADHFEISLRTVYRDIAALSEVGVPIVAEAGVGYCLMKGYYLPPIMFTKDEATALGMAAMALQRSSEPSLEASIGSALMKVKAALPREQLVRLEKVEESVAFGWQKEKRNHENGVASLVDVQACLADSKAMRINYRTGGRNEITTRIVEPLGLIYYSERWHVIAWCCLRNDYRDFRLDRIDKLDMLKDAATVHGDFDLQQYLEDQRFEHETTQAKVFVKEFSLDRAKRDWALGLIGEEVVEGGSILTLATGSLEWMLGWLLSFRDNVSVVGPPELKDMLVKEARRLVDVYAK